MDRFDIVLTGLDPERDRAEVIAALAKRLARSRAEIDELVASAPSTMLRAVSAAAAQSVVTELRKLGARVKPRAEEAELAPIGDAPADQIELTYRDPDDYERPAPSDAVEPAVEPAPQPVDAAPAPPRVEAPIDAPVDPSIAAIIVRDAGDWHAPAAAPPPPGLAALVLTPIAASPDARRGRASKVTADPSERPRVFFRALPDALALPFRRPAIGALARASALGVVTMALAAFGLRTGPAVVAFAVASAVGLAGLAMQLAASCLAATSTGARAPLPLPDRLMDDYLKPGLGLVLALCALGFATELGATELRARGVGAAVLIALGVFVSLYAVLGFALSAANGTASAYLDAPRILGLAFRSPVRALVVGVLGAGSMGGALVLAAMLLDAALSASSPLRIAFYLGALGPPVSFLASYGAALTGATMGLLLYARPAAR